MTLDELIKFHEREFKDEKSKRVTLGDDLTYKATVYKQTIIKLNELAWARRKLESLANNLHALMEVSDIEDVREVCRDLIELVEARA